MFEFVKFDFFLFALLSLVINKVPTQGPGMVMCAVISVGLPKLRTPQNNSSMSQNVEEITQKKKEEKERIPLTNLIYS